MTEKIQSFTETVRAALFANGWEIYEGLELTHLYEWWWKPAEHKSYWRTPENDYSEDPDKCRDWYMPIDQAIGQQMRADKATSR